MIYVGFEIEIEAIQDNNSFNSDMSREDTNRIMALAKSASSLIGEHNFIENYHEGVSNINKWRLEHDCSLKHGAEFISPPEPIDIAINKLFEFFKYLNMSKCTTTDSCGLHFNMSSDNMTIDENCVSLIIPFINNRLLFRLWKNRYMGNDYLIGMQKLLSKSVNSIMKQYSSFKLIKAINPNAIQSSTNKGLYKISNEIGNILLNNRYNYVNKRRNGDKRYIEIRIIGGKNYHKKEKEIRQTVNHFAKILEVVSKNPQLLYKKTNKKMISYVNRAFKTLEKGDIFNPFRYSYVNDIALKRESKLIKNIHKYNSKELICKIKEIKEINDYNIKNHNYILRYFSACLVYRRDTWFRNYIGYHVIKFLHNNFSKKYCINILKNNGHFKDLNLILPSDEPKTNILWLAEIARHSSREQKESFVNNLSGNMINFFLKHRQIGLMHYLNEKQKEVKIINSKKEGK